MPEITDWERKSESSIRSVWKGRFSTLLVLGILGFLGLQRTGVDGDDDPVTEAMFESRFELIRQVKAKSWRWKIDGTRYDTTDRIVQF